MIVIAGNGTPSVKLEPEQVPAVYFAQGDNPLVVFIPEGDDAFSSKAHRARLVVSTDAGVWLFNTRLDDD